MSKPLAVLISDIHVGLPTLEISLQALIQAIFKSNDLQVPLIVAGDLHDTKANMRGECVNAMIDAFRRVTNCYVLRGNHDQINEKSKDHSLNFLHHIDDYNSVSVIDGSVEVLLDYDKIVYLIPYHHDVEELRAYLKTIPKGSTIIMHQGLNGSNSGEYIQDRSALEYKDVEDFRVISGHYHRRQDIKTGRPRKGAVGLFSYIGNPYTLNFAEASDPEKGFQILMDDGTLEFVPTNLRRHVVIELEVDSEGGWVTNYSEKIQSSDLIRVKVTGPSDELAKTTKERISKFFGITQSFRLDLIPIDTTITAEERPKAQTQTELLDSLIDSLSNTDKIRKTRMKDMYKDFLTKG